MSREPLVPPKPAATGRKWNLVLVMLVLAVIPCTSLALIVSAYQSPNAIRLGSATLLGPTSAGVPIFIIRQPQPAGPAGTVLLDSYRYAAGSAGKPAWSMRVRGKANWSHVSMVGPKGPALAVVTGKHLWRLGDFTLVLN